MYVETRDMLLLRWSFFSNHKLLQSITNRCCFTTLIYYVCVRAHTCVHVCVRERLRVSQRTAVGTGFASTWFSGLNSMVISLEDKNLYQLTPLLKNTSHSPSSNIKIEEMFFKLLV